jgi:SpoVK/Ycf46/Vps4 family AAA+-type ATPase
MPKPKERDGKTQDEKGIRAEKEQNKTPISKRLQKINHEEGNARDKSRDIATLLPLSAYWIKDFFRALATHKNFPDALATTFALLSLSIAIPYFPMPVLLIILAITFILTLVHPLFGLASMLFFSLASLIYQVPLLAWLFIIFISVALMLGYKHYRTITFTYMLITLPLSYVGSLLEIPALVLTILTVGFKRSAIAVSVAILIVVMVSGLTGLQITGGIAYNPVPAHSVILNQGNNFAAGVVPVKYAATTLQFLGTVPSLLSGLFSYSVAVNIPNAMIMAFYPLEFGAVFIIMQIVLWVIVAYIISSYALASRSRYKGSEASLFSAVIIVGYIFFSYASGSQLQLEPIFSLAILVAALFLFEYNGMDVVTAMNVMKEDFRRKFGEGFEDLTTGANEKFRDIANYDSTKAELKAAIMAPIEQRALAGAYNIKPAKGVLLFGPPGTGKTLMMRALANELHAGFFYVKASSILSPYSGETAKTISKIFAIAKKNAPSILFFDEIDGIAGSREMKSSDEGRQALSTLLAELDGFQKVENIVVVGSTNMPQSIDPALMRPGRFDKILYMPLPDKEGRKKIFLHYLSKLPISRDINLDKLAEITERYSGADIKNVCDESARLVAEEASKKRTVLKIDMYDIVSVIRKTKPSTSISQLEQYDEFKMDYERRTGKPNDAEEANSDVTLDDVIGLDEAKKALYEAVELPILHPDLIKKYNISSTSGMLLFGPPGTGKTMLMRAVANEIGEVKVIVISGTDIMKEGKERAILGIKKAFDRARENSPSILFIDEIDTVSPSRETATEEGASITGEILQEIDGMKGKYRGKIVFIGATNRPDNIDPALLRPGRFDNLIFVRPPNADERESLFKRYMKDAPISDDINYQKLAESSEGYTGADIADICRRAKLDALERSLDDGEEKVSMDDITRQLKSAKPSAPSQEISAYLSFLMRYGKR